MVSLEIISEKKKAKAYKLSLRKQQHIQFTKQAKLASLEQRLVLR